MVIRIFQLIFISFWLFTIGLLVKSEFWPSESGMVELDLRRPLQTVLKWSDSARLKLYQNGKEIGVLSVSSGKYTTAQSGRITFSLNLNKDVRRSISGVFSNFSFDFNEDLTLQETRVMVRIPSAGMITNVTADAEQNILASVKINDVSVFNYDSKIDDKLPIPAFMANNPMVSNMLASTDSMEKQLTIKSYHGMHRFKKRQLPVFMIKLATENNVQEMRLYFSKTGDPLLVESNFGIYAISELFTTFDAIPKEES